MIAAADQMHMQMSFDPKEMGRDWATIKADYNASGRSKYVRDRLGLPSGGGAADYHIRNEFKYLQLIEKSRDMSRNDSVIGKTIEKAACNCVQDGFVVKPDTGDKEADKDILAMWNEWAEDADQCDIRGESTWHDMEVLAVMHALEDGDVLGIGTEDGALQMIEGHQCRNPHAFRKNKVNSVLGIEVNENKRATRYHIRHEDNNPYSTTQAAKSTPYDARDSDGYRQVFHFHTKKRLSSTRGVTCLAPVFQIGAMFDDVNFAKVVQQQAVSCFAFLRYRDSKHNLPTVETDYGTPTTDSQGRMSDDIQPGAELTANKGEKLEGFSPNVPNQEYFEHVRLLLMMIGINVGVPYVEMMMDASDANFSAYRGAVDTARRNWRRTQHALRERWHEPAYRWKVRQFVTNDDALRKTARRDGIQILRHRWQPPAWPYIQPVDDAAAQLIRVRNGLTSPRRLHMEMSQTWETIYQETVDDNAAAIEYAMQRAAKINENLPEGQQAVHWREVLALPTPDGIQIGLGTNAGANNAQR